MGLDCDLHFFSPVTIVYFYRTTAHWIRAHCRIEGNERADRLAKEGSVLEQIESDLTYREVKSIIKTSLNNK